MKTVFFDFDKTLTKIDTLIIFAIYVFIKTHKIHKLIAIIYAFILFRLKIIKSHVFKQFYAKLVFGKLTSRKISNFSNQFLKKYFYLIRLDESIKILKKNLALGNKVYIVSSNFDLFLFPLICQWQISGIIATQIETINGFITGNIKGIPCNGMEKLKRVLEKFDIITVKQADAYGDSEGDYDLLKFVKNGYLVKSQKFFSNYYFDKFK